MREALLILLIAIGALVMGVFGAWVLMIRMPGRSFAGPLPPLSAAQEATRARLETDIQSLAGRIGERNFMRPAALDAAAAYIETAFTKLGYEAVSQTFTVDGRVFRNLEVTLPGRHRPEEVFVVGAHYDSVVGTPGADDNASGIAALLELARLFKDGGGGPPERTLRLVAFTNEEKPFAMTENMGSRVYAQAAAQRADRIVGMFSLESMGYYSSVPGSQHYPWPLNLAYPDRGDFVGFVGNIASRSLVRRSIAVFRRHARFPSAGIAAPSGIPGIGWSDHASFWRQGYPALMITDTAPFRNPHYHKLSDTPERVDCARLARVVQGLVPVVQTLLGNAGD